MQILGNIMPFFISHLDNFSRREVISLAYISIENILGFNKSDCILRNEFELNKNQINIFKQIVTDLKKEIPIQYILGETEFCNLRIKVNTSTLIPRKETEELVSWILEHKFNSLLDIGTGSGCISISIAKHSSASISALDISQDALDIAQNNANYHNVNINFMCENIFKYIPKSKYDVIVSNPPYVLESEKLFMSKNVLEHEPHSALFVKDIDSLKFYKRIAYLSSKYLNENGVLFFEINEKFGDEIINLLADYNFVDIELKKDINGRDRMVKSVLK